MTLARRMGFVLLPCACHGDCAHTSATVAAFDPTDERRSLLRAVARGLLLRRGVAATADVDALSREIGA